MSIPRKWVPYDSKWLVELAAQQHPDKQWLQNALKRCTQCRRESKAYLHFVDPQKPNEVGSEWQFKTNLELESPSDGWIILDILKGGRVGGVEFVDRLE